MTNPDPALARALGRVGSGGLKGKRFTFETDHAIVIVHTAG